MSSLKTTMAGIVAVTSGILYLANTLFAVVAPEITTPAAAVAAIAAGVGLIFGRDNKTSDESASAK